jgi:hypothetical protein
MWNKTLTYLALGATFSLTLLSGVVPRIILGGDSDIFKKILDGSIGPLFVISAIFQFYIIGLFACTLGEICLKRMYKAERQLIFQHANRNHGNPVFLDKYRDYLLKRELSEGLFGTGLIFVVLGLFTLPLMKEVSFWWMLRGVIFLSIGIALLSMLLKNYQSYQETP